MHRRIALSIALLALLCAAPLTVSADEANDVATAYPFIMVLDPAPPPNSIETVLVRLTANSDGTNPLARITVCARWYFPDITTRFVCSITDANGDVRLSHPIAKTASGQTVKVTLTALVTYDWSDLGTVVFTPQ